MPGSSSYPTGLDNFAESSPTNLGDSDGTGRTHSERHDDVEASIEAIEGELGTTPSGVYPTVAARLDAIAGAGAASISLNAGTANAPSFYFTGDTNTGVYSPGADTFAISTGGTERLRVGSAGQVTTVLGSASAPAIAPTGDTNTGIFSPGADTLAVSTGGTERLRVTSGGRLGLGTTSPARALHVVGGVVGTHIAVNSTSDAFGAGTLASDANWGMFYASNTGAAIAAHAFADSSSTVRMQIASDGLITGTGTSLGAWTAWTPTLGGTGWALGDGTLTGAYCQIGKIVHFRGEILFGGTSTFGAGALTIALPVTAKSSTQNAAIARFRDVSTSTNILGVARSFTTSTLGFGYNNATPAETGITTNAPFTWANGDFIYFSGTYEAA